MLSVKDNILVDQIGRARLADFGLLTFISDPTNPTTTSTVNNFGGTRRWMSPELLYPQKFGLERSRPTQSSDCYALGMVILEVLSDEVPFSRHQGYVVVQMVLADERPERPKRRGLRTICGEPWVSVGYPGQQTAPLSMPYSNVWNEFQGNGNHCLPSWKMSTPILMSRFT